MLAFDKSYKCPLCGFKVNVLSDYFRNNHACTNPNCNYTENTTAKTTNQNEMQNKIILTITFVMLVLVALIVLMESFS
ncbi:hypothetical protein IT568_10340 [bacterium]|nr:hypothetical protein [bacterium]